MKIKSSIKIIGLLLVIIQCLGCVIVKSKYSDPIIDNQVKLKYWKYFYYTSFYSHQQYVLRQYNDNILIEFYVHPNTAGIALVPDPNWPFIAAGMDNGNIVFYTIKKGNIECSDLMPEIESHGMRYVFNPIQYPVRKTKFKYVDNILFSNNKCVFGYDGESVLTGEFILKTKVKDDKFIFPDVKYKHKESLMWFPLIWY